MIRTLVRNFQRLHVLETANRLPIITTNGTVQQFPLINAIARRGVVNINKAPATTEPIVPTVTTDETKEPQDADYIVSYPVEYEMAPTVNAVVEVLRSRYRLTNAELKEIMNDDVVNRKYREKYLKSTLETLELLGINRQTFIDYPWLITLEKSTLKKKVELLQSMVHNDFNHLAVFLRLSLPRLRKLVSALNRESETVPLKNRIYYIADKLKIDPYIVTKFLSKRLFVLEMPFDMLEMNLKHMINYNVSSMNVLKDLWAFRYTPKSVELRLERAKRAKKDKIMPWMVRCTEPILQRSLKLSLDEMAILGDKSNTVEYIAERLQFSVEETKAILAKHPLVLRVRVTKIKEILDYLMNEAHFTRYEIAQVPRILCHSLETTKKRLNELEAIGCRPTSLVIVCRSKREYEKFLNSWMATANKVTIKLENDNKKSLPL